MAREATHDWHGAKLVRALLQIVRASEAAPISPHTRVASRVLTPRYARPRGRSHYTVAVHSTHTTSALTRSPHLKGLASSRQPRGATRGQEGDARVGPPPHTLATHRARTRHGSIAGSPVLLPQYIHSVHS